MQPLILKRRPRSYWHRQILTNTMLCTLIHQLILHSIHSHSHASGVQLEENKKKLSVLAECVKTFTQLLEHNIYTSHLAHELHLRLLRVFGGPQVFKTFSRGQRLIVRLILAAENTTQEGDIGEPFTDWAGRSSVNFYPKCRLVSMQQVNLFQGMVWLWSVGIV